MFSKKTYNLIFLIAIGFTIYAFNLNNPLFWDDDEWIKGNPFVHDLSHLKVIFTQNILSGFGLNSDYWRPVLLLSFAFNYVLHGVKPFGYHLLSNSFHIASGVLVFLLLTRFLGQRAAFLVSLLFLIHPVQTEAVTYISGRGDPMSVFFMLLALGLFSFGRLKRSFLYSSLSLISMILAVLSRETAILFPIFLMVFYIAFWGSGGFWRSVLQSLIKALPYWAVSITYGVLRLTVLNFKNTLNFYSQANDYTQHLSYRLFTFGHALVEYFRLIFVPVGLHMERDLALKTSLFQWPVWLAALLMAVIFFGGVALYQRERHKLSSLESGIQRSVFRVSSFKIWFFGWAWFFVALLPVSGIIPINAVMYEHWLYLPLIGFFALAGFYIDKALVFLKSKKLIVPTGSWILDRYAIGTYSLLLIALIAYFSFLTIASAKRNVAWGKPIRFYEDILKYNPYSVRILNNLGNLYSESGDLDKAVQMYQRSIEGPAGNIFAQPHYNLGNIYRDRREIDRAVAEYQKAIEIDPKFPFAYQNLAVIYAERGQLTEAATMLEKVKELRPGVPRLYYNLGLVYLAQNKKQLAIDNLTAGLKLSGNDPEVKSAITSLLDKLK